MIATLLPISEAIPVEFTIVCFPNCTNHDTVKRGQVRPVRISAARFSFIASLTPFRDTRWLATPVTTFLLLQGGPEIADCGFTDRIGTQPTHAGCPANRNDIRCHWLQLRQIVEFQAAGER